MAVFLSACSSLSGGGEKARGGDEIGRLITRETGEDARAAPGPSPSTFIGASVVRLDRLLGEPDLVRREGQNEFRARGRNGPHAHHRPLGQRPERPLLPGLHGRSLTIWKLFPGPLLSML